MSAVHDFITGKAIDLVAAGVKNPTLDRLAAFLSVDVGDCAAALSTAPDHVREAFGLASNKPHANLYSPAITAQLRAGAGARSEHNAAFMTATTKAPVTSAYRVRR